MVPPGPRVAGCDVRARGLSCAVVAAGTRAEAEEVPSEVRGLYLAYPGDSEGETSRADPGTRRAASCLEVAGLVSQREEGRVTA